MKNPKDINRLIEKLRACWLSHPFLRLGQLMFILESQTDTELFYLEDFDLELAINNLKENTYVRN